MHPSDGDLNTAVIGARTTRLQMGVDPANQIEIKTNGTLTFSAGGGDLFQTGDEIEIITGDPAVGTVRYLVSARVDVNTLQLNNVSLVAIASAVLNFTRIRNVSVNEARGVSDFELIWTPPLSIFTSINHCLPGMRAELILNPQTASNYQKYAIQTLISAPLDKIPNTATTGAASAGSNYIFNVQDMYFYCNTVEGPRADDVTYMLDLQSVSCQSEQFSGNQASFQQKNFTVSPSTTSLSVAYQDSRSGNDSRFSPSKFKVSNPNRTANSEEQKLSRFFINYAGINLPAPKLHWVCAC